MKTRTDPTKIMHGLLQEINRMALQYVEAAAREILVSSPELSEFVMGMGAWFFTYKLGVVFSDGLKVTKGNDILYGPDRYPRLLPVVQFMNEWDSLLGLTGNPTRFTAKGKKRTGW